VKDYHDGQRGRALTFVLIYKEMKMKVEKFSMKTLLVTLLVVNTASLGR